MSFLLIAFFLLGAVLCAPECDLAYISCIANETTCTSDFDACSAAVAILEMNATTCTTDYTICMTNLGISEIASAECFTSLSACTTNATNLTTALGESQNQEAICAAALTDCALSAETCATNLGICEQALVASEYDFATATNALSNCQSNTLVLDGYIAECQEEVIACGLNITYMNAYNECSILLSDAQASISICNAALLSSETQASQLQMNVDDCAAEIISLQVACAQQHEIALNDIDALEVDLQALQANVDTLIIELEASERMKSSYRTMAMTCESSLDEVNIVLDNVHREMDDLKHEMDGRLSVCSDPGLKWPECTIPIKCFGISAYSPYACGKNGFCIAEDTCVCFENVGPNGKKYLFYDHTHTCELEGTYQGKEGHKGGSYGPGEDDRRAALPDEVAPVNRTCFNVSALDATVCGEHGFCSYQDVCSCEAGYVNSGTENGCVLVDDILALVISRMTGAILGTIFGTLAIIVFVLIVLFAVCFFYYKFKQPKLTPGKGYNPLIDFEMVRQ